MKNCQKNMKKCERKNDKYLRFTKVLKTNKF